jgi:type II secretory pathway pseudopilin PulG
MRWASLRAGDDAPGLALAEVLVAIAVVVTFAAGVLPLFVTTRGALDEAHGATMSTVLARSKLDQLRSLAWTYRIDPLGVLWAVADETTDLSSDPPSRSGQGLRPSAHDNLWNNAAGYADFLDEQGAWVGGGVSPPPACRYVRRWAVSEFPGDPETLVLQVRVVPVRGGSDVAVGPLPGARRGDTWLVSLLTRTRP